MNQFRQLLTMLRVDTAEITTVDLAMETFGCLRISQLPQRLSGWKGTLAASFGVLVS